MMTEERPTSQPNIWLRGLYMVLFAIIYNVAEILMIAVALFQFIHKLLSGNINQRLSIFGHSLSLFVYQIWRFLTFNSDTLPFPFTAWPNAADSPEQAAKN